MDTFFVAESLSEQTESEELKSTGYESEDRDESDSEGKSKKNTTNTKPQVKENPAELPTQASSTSSPDILHCLKPTNDNPIDIIIIIITVKTRTLSNSTSKSAGYLRERRSRCPNGSKPAQNDRSRECSRSGGSNSTVACAEREPRPCPRLPQSNHETSRSEEIKPEAKNSESTVEPSKVDCG